MQITDRSDHQNHNRTNRSQQRRQKSNEAQNNVSPRPHQISATKTKDMFNRSLTNKRKDTNPIDEIIGTAAIKQKCDLLNEAELQQ